MFSQSTMQSLRVASHLKESWQLQPSLSAVKPVAKGITSQLSEMHEEV